MMKRKLISLCTFLLSVIVMLGASACGLISFGEKQIVASVVKTEPTMVAIKVEKAEENAMLVDVMEALQAEGALTFTVDASGMVSGINGTSNPSDWSACWMIYTSDTEFSNEAWGVYEYEGQTLGSATLGAEALPVAEGALYVWVYQSF